MSLSTEHSTTPGRELRFWVSRMLRIGSIRVTRSIARNYGTYLNFRYVGGYPKSGTTWVAQMVAHYLDVPLVDYNYLPNATQNSLIHHHWKYEPAFDRSIQVLRDGRDVMVSLYMSLMKDYGERTQRLGTLKGDFGVRWLVSNTGEYSAIRRRLVRLYGPNFDPMDVTNNLSRFIEVELQRPFLPAVRVSWPEHVDSWRSRAQCTAFVKYEDLLADRMNTAAKMLESYLGSAVNPQDLEYTLQRYSFKRQTGREPGIEDRKSFARKGISGDWKNYFSKEARQIFDHYAGQALIELGYEKDHSWVENQ